jgi:hypothetical protein
VDLTEVRRDCSCCHHRVRIRQVSVWDQVKMKDTGEKNVTMIAG